MLPGMGVTPQQQAEMQKVSQHIKGEIRIDYTACTVNVKLTSNNADAVAIIPILVEQLGQALAQQLSAFFAITGEIVEVNKPDDKAP